MSGAHAVATLLNPRSVAVVGASADATRTGGRPVAYLLKHGYAGAIYPVNPRVDRIGALPCFPSVAALPQAPDVALVLLGADRAAEAVRALAARGTVAAIVLAGGYGEAGPEGARRQRELHEAAGPMRLLGPNTIGLVNLTDRVVLSASGALEVDDPPRGGIGLVSQSGGVLGSLLSRAAARGIGLSKLVSTGNEADLELADFVDALACDEATSVIALYVEAVRRPDRFRAAALRAAEAGKPVVCFKVGRSEGGARAAASHTGALAGTDRMVDALFRDSGVVRAQTFADLLDMPAALATGRRLRGRRVAILTSTGGAGTLVADSLGLAGFETPPPDAGTATALRALQPDDAGASGRNPVDVTLAGLQPDVLQGSLRALLRSPTYDALAVVVGSSALARPELMAGAIQRCVGDSDKPVIAYVSPHAPELAADLTRRGVPAYAFPEGCSAALTALRGVRPAPRRSARALPVPVDPGPLPSGALDEAQAKRLFAAFGVPGPREEAVGTPGEAHAAALRIGGRVALKVLDARITHKTDAGGVALGLDPPEVPAALAAMAAEVRARTGLEVTRFLVQEMVPPGVELVVGARRDPLGMALLVGAGGVWTELFDDTSLRLLPPDGGLDAGEVLEMLRELKSWPLLDGHRGRPVADVAAAVDAVLAFARMAAGLGGRLIEAEINPLVVLPAGRGVRAVDGVVLLAPA